MSKEIDILLIENHRDHAFVFRQVLDRMGGYYSFFLAENFLEGLDYFRKAEEGKYRMPELIVLSLDLPEAAALDLLQFRMQNKLFMGVPVIALFDQASEGLVNRAYQNYVNCCIMRPDDLARHASIVAVIWTYWLEVARMKAQTAVEVLLPTSAKED